MRGFKKNLTLLLTVFVMTVCMAFSGAANVFAEEAIDPTTEAQILENVKSLTDSIIRLRDEEIENYIENGNDFSKNAIEAWNGVKKELGEKKEDQSAVKAPSVVLKDKTYTVTMPVDFENEDADFVYTLDQNISPKSLTVNVNYSMATTMVRAALNTVMGVGIVFLVLIFLSFIISLFKYIPNGETKGTAKGTAASEEKRAVETAPAAAPEEELVDDLELVAVITAAIAASQGKASPEGFVVRSIRKARRTR